MNESPKRKLAYGRIAWAAIGVIMSAVIAAKYGDRLTNSSDTLSMIATVFSVLAGVLIAIISILGDPSMLIDQSWRYNSALSLETQRKIHRNTDIFILYVLILIVIVVFGMVDNDEDIYPYAQKLCLFLVSLGFWASLWLPFSLKQIQNKRLKDAIEAKKNGYGG